MRGPIDYLVVGFNGSTFDGSVLKTLGEAADKGLIKILVLTVVSKDKQGVFSELNVLNVVDQQTVEFVRRYNIKNDHLTSDDTNEVAELLENDTTAGLLVYENLWAKPIKQAIMDKGGFLIVQGRISPEVAAELDMGGE